MLTLSEIIAKLKFNNIETLLIANYSVDPADFHALAPHVTVMQMNRNMGTAFAYNLARIYALSNASVRFLLLLDQDSIPSDQYLKFCLKCCAKAECRARSIYCPRDKKNIATSLRQKKSVILSKCLDGYKYREIFDAKSSGMLIPISILKQFSFDESLFVDYVDWEYCWRIRRAGFNIYELTDISLNNHQLGNPYCVFNSKRLFYFPSSGRRSIQARSAVNMLINIHKFAGAPLLRICAIFSRLFLNPILDLLEEAEIIRPINLDA